MNYFELFKIPVSLKVEVNTMLKQYYLLNKEYHPDNFTLSDKAAQEKSERMTAFIHEAKKVLDSPYRRLEYILKERQVIIEDEKYALPASFLGQMMDINEQLMELEFERNDEQLTQIRNEVDLVQAAIDKEVARFFEQEILVFNEEEATLLKSYYYKKKYLQRIMERLS